jgi:hypothetical protein
LFSVHAANRTAVRSIPELTGVFRVRLKEIPMTSRTMFLAAAAAIGAVAVSAPASAQYQQSYQYPQYQQPYQQPYAQPYQGYGQAYGQGYAQNPVGAIIDQLLGNRYNVTDRQAVSQCASAAMAQAGAQYGGYGYRSQGYAGGGMRVTSITDVQRRYNGLRVKGLMTAGFGPEYGRQNGYQNYQNRGYGAQQLSFRCDVDYRGAVTNIRIGGNRYRGY